jgi:adenosylhomocysteine nucleosidase
LISFGLAGGLDPALRPGTIIIPSIVLCDDDSFQADATLADRFGGLTPHLLFAGSAVAVDAAAKRHLHATSHAHAIDLESGAVAGVAGSGCFPFVVVRAICDPAERALPPAALAALDRKGRISVARVLRSILVRPRQISDLVALARDAATARRALLRLTERLPASG